MLGILGLFLVSMMGGVLAVTGEGVGRNVGGFMKGFAEGIAAFFTEAVGADSGISQFFFFILLAMIIYTFVSSFFSDTNNTIRWIITLAISSLAMIGIPKEFVTSLLVSYGAMGLTILTIIPLLVVLVFSIKVKNLMLARATWAFYAIYYAAIVFRGIADNGDTEWFYWVAAIIGGLMFWLVPYIRKALVGEELKKDLETAEAAIKKNIQIQKLAKQSREGEVGAATS